MIIRSLSTILLTLLATADATLRADRSNAQQGGPDARRNTDPNVSTIINVPTTAFTSYQTGNLRRSKHFQPSNKSATTERDAHWNCTEVPAFTWGDADRGGLGIRITNADSTWRAFFVYHNTCDYIPYKYIWVNSNSTEFVSLPAGFAGRIVRGTDEVGSNQRKFMTLR